MQKLAELCIRRPIFASMLIIGLMVVGAATWMNLAVDRFPAVDLPTIRVRTALPGASTEEAEVQVTERIEEAVNTVSGLDELRSVSMPGTSMVMPTFELDRDIDSAAQDVRDRVATVLRDLPSDTQPPLIAKIDNDAMPILTLAVAGQRSQRELTEIADKLVRRALERSRGVGEVTVAGGHERAISVWVDAERLAAYRLPIREVRDALERQNTDLPGGTVTTPTTEQTLRTFGRVTDAAEFNDLVIKTINGAPVRIRDIGWVEDGTKEQRSVALLDGVPTVIVEVRRQTGANTIAVIGAVKANLDRVRAQLPADVRLEIIRDQSKHITAALHEINVHLVLGSILACLVVLLFMRNWRATVIAGVAIPASVISTFGLMGALDFTLNSVTMLALVLTVGIVIDDAIVVLENIFRFVEEKKLGAFEAARQATAEIALPVMATTMSLVVIFIPVSFMSSISGRFLYQFGFTAAAAILVSLLVSFTLTPMMSARMMRTTGSVGHGPAAARIGFYAVIERVYMRLLHWAMRHRIAVVTTAALVGLSAIPLYGLVGQDYVPSNVDEAEFQMQVFAPEGTSLPAMAGAIEVVEREVRTVPGVQSVLANVGDMGGAMLGQVNRANLFIRIAPHDERVFSITRLVKGLVRLRPLEAFQNNYSQQDVMRAMRERMRRRFPDLDMVIRNLQSFNIGGGFYEFELVFRGPDLVKLSELAEGLRARASDLGLVDAQTTLKLDRPELQVRIDRARAADLRVDSEQIAQALRLMVGGDEEVTRFYDVAVNEEYDVQLRLTPEDRADPADDLATLRPARGRRPRAPRQPREARARGQRGTGRSARSPALREPSRRHRPGLLAGRPHRGRARRGRADGAARRLLDHGHRPRPRAGTHGTRVRVGVSAVDHLHVHDSRDAVR